MNEDHKELQKVLDMMSMFRSFEVKFSNEKSKVLVENGENEDDNKSWMIGGKRIHRTKCYKYMGMMLDEKGCEKPKYVRIGRSNQRMGRLGSISRCRAVLRYKVGLEKMNDCSDYGRCMNGMVKKAGRYKW